MGGYRVPERTERLIVDTYDSLKKYDKNPSAQKVLNACQDYVKRNKRNDIFLPKIRKVQQILAKVIKLGDLPEDERIQEELWNMASSYPLPPESLPYIVQIWRYASHTDEKFTIRQAKWVSRLYPFMSFMGSFPALWVTSYIYAKKEHLSAISNTTFDSFTDDVNLIMRGLELQTFLEIHTSEKSLIDIFRIGAPLTREKALIEEALHPLDYYHDLENGTVVNHRDRQLMELLIEFPALGTLKLSDDMRMVYVSWFTYIRRTPDWPKLTAEQALDVIKKLREWAVVQQSILLVGDQQRTIRFKKTSKEHQFSFVSRLATPEQALKLLSEYATKGGTK